MTKQITNNPDILTLKKKIHRLEIALQQAEQIGENTVAKLFKAKTDLEEMQEKMLLSEKIKATETLASGISHEIKNPLAYILQNFIILEEYVNKMINCLKAFNLNRQTNNKSTGEIFEQHLSDDLDFIAQDSLDILASCRGGLERIDKIIKNLNSFSSKQSDFAEVDLEKCVDKAIAIAVEEYNIKNVIQKKADDRNFLINGNALLLTQVIVNLLSNARDASAKTTPIEISLIKDHKKIVLRIKDYGAGLTSEEKKKMFDPFFTTKKVGQGMGLGMHIVLHVLNQHLADIAVVSEKNEGTTVSLTFKPFSKSLECMMQQPHNRKEHG